MSTTVKPLPLHDRSRIVKDWSCQRAAYYSYEADGTGYQSGTSAYELFFGTLAHDATATIAKFHEAGEQVPINDIAQAGYHQLHEALSAQLTNDDGEYALEQASLLEGLIRGFYKSAWPNLIESYSDIIAIEQEIVYEHDGCEFMSKPDLILANSEGHLIYVEYKTTGWANEKWLESWETSPQLHSTMHAIQQTTGYPVAAAQVVGLYKGSKYHGRQSSPFCYAYNRPAHPPFVEQELNYTYKAGFKKYPTWQLEGGVERWVKGMPDDLLKEQFPFVPPVYYRDYLAERFFSQSAIRRKEIELAKQFLEADADLKEDILDVSFRQNFEQCKPAFGSPCAFYKLCHENKEGKHPLELGFSIRQPHHQPEIDRQASLAQSSEVS